MSPSSIPVWEVPDGRFWPRRHNIIFWLPITDCLVGWDLFAPAAAWLATGEPASSFGRVIGDPVVLPLAFPITQDGMLVGQIEYVDRFGNLITNITAQHVREWQEAAERPHPAVHVGTCIIEGLVANYSEGGHSSPSALINGCGKLEIFLDQQSAAQHLQIGVGEEVRLG
jgi:S-adenosylmethionine hydrolase